MEAGSEWWIPSGPTVNPPRHMDGLGLGGDGVQVQVGGANLNKASRVLHALPHAGFHARERED